MVYVDNSVAANGDGSLENPFNNLADAQAALQAYGVLYIKSGTGDTTNMQDGLSLTAAHAGVKVIGEGSDFVYDDGSFTTSTAGNFDGTILRAAGVAPEITNLNAGGDGVDIAASGIMLAGFTVENANRHGIHILKNDGDDLTNIALHNLAVIGSGEDGIRIHADGAGSSAEVNIADVATTGNKNGIRYYASNNASVSGLVQESTLSSNTQHGIIIYDDSASGSVNVDLGGGGQSSGNNALFGNTLEDIALDIDGGSLFARNNWWGQSGGADQDDPSDGRRPQIYYGAPMDNGLAGHWTFDTEWTNNTTAYDRAGNTYAGTLSAGLSLADLVASDKRQAMTFSGGTDHVNAGDVLDLGTNDMTIVMFGTLIDPPSSAFYFSKSRAAGQNYRFAAGIRTNGEMVGFINGTGADVVPKGAVVTDGNSHMLAAVYDRSGNLSLFDNNVLTGGASIAHWDGLNFQSNNPLYIGAYPHANNITPTRFYLGTIEDMRIYHRVLTGSELAELQRMNTNSVVDVSGHLIVAP